MLSQVSNELAVYLEINIFNSITKEYHLRGNPKLFYASTILCNNHKIWAMINSSVYRTNIYRYVSELKFLHNISNRTSISVK